MRKIRNAFYIELHVYHGLFGTHVALIMRRLRRLCSYNNNHDLQFISCSATINEPDKVKDLESDRKKNSKWLTLHSI